MSKHTAGKWEYYTQPQPNGCPIVGSGGIMVCQLAHSINHLDQANEAIANAKLISAAPELLDALRDMLSGWRYIRETHGDLYGVGWDRAEAKAVSAITKAIGEQP